MEICAKEVFDGERDTACAMVAPVRWVRFLNDDSVLNVQRANLVFLLFLPFSTFYFCCFVLFCFCPKMGMRLPETLKGGPVDESSARANVCR